MTDPAFVVQLGLAGVFGAVIGSFLNVCIYRLPRHESVVRPASHCTRCGYTLTWYDNVPVLSYLVLRGRCRSCRAPVSLQYPLVEIITAVAVALEFARWGLSAGFIAHSVFVCLMIVLFATDLEERILPDAITIPGTVVGFVVAVLIGPGWRDSLIGLLVGGGTLFLLGELYYRVRGEEGMGFGDVKMMAMVGAWLGWQLTILTLLFGSFVGSFVGVAFILARGRDLKYALPFGTFLAVAAVIADTAGGSILAWYLGFYA